MAKVVIGLGLTEFEEDLKYFDNHQFQLSDVPTQPQLAVSVLQSSSSTDMQSRFLIFEGIGTGESQPL